MTLNLINSNLPKREIKIIATNGDENIAIVLDDDKDLEEVISSKRSIDDNNKQGKRKYEIRHAYYERNREKLLQYFLDYYSLNKKEILRKKKKHNELPHVKQHSSEYHKKYYLLHKIELKKKHREYLERKNNKK